MAVKRYSKDEIKFWANKVKPLIKKLGILKFWISRTDVDADFRKSKPIAFAIVKKIKKVPVIIFAQKHHLKAVSQKEIISQLSKEDLRLADAYTVKIGKPVLSSTINSKKSRKSPGYFEGIVTLYKARVKPSKVILQGAEFRAR